MVKRSTEFIPVFIDTLTDLKQTERFGENFGSYPVLRIHNLKGEDIGGRIDTNRTAGIIGATELIEQFDLALRRFKNSE